jgi:hypothetical protein
MFSEEVISYPSDMAVIENYTLVTKAQGSFLPGQRPADIFLKGKHIKYVKPFGSSDKNPGYYIGTYTTI